MGNTSTVVMCTAVFFASLVEMVEALTIVVAAGSTRGWRSALEGTAVALLVLGVLVGVVGVPLIHWVPIDTLRIVVGALLLVLGLAWLRKAILRSSGHLPLHDEDAIRAKKEAELTESGRDGIAFVVAFKGVFLEGLEVVLIVISLGGSSHRLGLAAVSALGAGVLVAAVGAVVARQLSEVPENSIKTVVGIMLTSFGLFWVGEGAGINWPGGDLSIPLLIAFFVVVTVGGITWMKASLNGTETVQ